MNAKTHAWLLLLLYVSLSLAFVFKQYPISLGEEKKKRYLQYSNFMGTCGCFCRNLTTFMILWSLKRHHLWLIDSFFQRWSWPDFGKKRTRFRSKSRDEMSVAKSVGSDRVMWAFQGHFRVEQKKKKSVFSCLNSLWHNFWTKNRVGPDRGPKDRAENPFIFGTCPCWSPLPIP